ncbi:MAG TPA: hypothetical protein VLC09_10460, partial [Polyangiaceae bacterium]|nr:hypothetical protein [Polyangiaceae bacterium]
LVPRTTSDDDDDVVVALETARVEEERGDNGEAARWLQRAAVAARKQGRPERAGEVSRAAARLSGSTNPPPAFEPLPDPTHVLSDADEDFADKTIVDRPPTPAPMPRPRSVPAPPPPTLEELERTSDDEPPPSEPAPAAPRAVVPRPSARPSAPVGTSGSVGQRPGIRVAARKTKTGTVEVRRLQPGEGLEPGEEEALLVPVRPNTKLF